MFSEMIEKSSQRHRYTCYKLRPRFDEFLSKLRRLEAVAGEEFENAFEVLHLKKGDFLLREGEVSRHIWFMQEGMARRYFNYDGKEITTDFFFDSEIIDIFDSSSLCLPSQSNVQMFTDATIFFIHWDTFIRLKSVYPILDDLERVMLGCYVHHLEQRHYAMLHIPATERYSQLLAQQPFLLKYIPLTCIASYLGIKMGSLSRIRKNLSL